MSLNDPDYLYKLADLADPEKLWQTPFYKQSSFTEDQKRQLDTGIALRRHASHLRELDAARAKGVSVLITPLQPHHTAHKTVATPPDHARLRSSR